MKKVIIGEHYLDKDIAIEVVNGKLTITAYTKNTGWRRFERVELTADVTSELKQILNENL